MMSLDEAIKHCEEVAEEQKEKAKEGRLQFETWDYISKCEECAKEHRQLAEWLRKLKTFEEAREEIIRRKYSDQWSKTVVVHIIDKHLREVNADE